MTNKEITILEDEIHKLYEEIDDACNIWWIEHPEQEERYEKCTNRLNALLDFIEKIGYVIDESDYYYYGFAIKKRG